MLFNAPLDASLSTSDCATPTDPLAPLGDLTLYAALQADVGLRQVGLAPFLPQAKTVTNVARRIFERGELVRDEIVAVAPGRVIRLDHAADLPYRAGGAALVVILLAAGAWLVRFGRRRRRNAWRGAGSVQPLATEVAGCVRKVLGALLTTSSSS